MFPENRLSSRPAIAAWREPVRAVGELLTDYEIAGVALNDGTQGLNVRQWICQVVRREEPGNPSGFSWACQIRPEGGAWVTIFERPTRVTEMAFAFDGNMNPFVTFEDHDGTRCWFHWYDPTIPGNTFVELPSGTQYPRCCIDEKNPALSADMDIVLAYIRSGNLYFRLLRDRFTIEHLLKSDLGPAARLVCLQMNNARRLQFRCRGAVNDSQSFTVADPFLSDIVEDLCERVGVGRVQLDTYDLFGDTVVGYPIMTNDSVIKQIEPLGAAFGFDPVEYNRKLRFHKRGRAAVLRFTYKDLVTVDKGSFRTKRVDETKLPIRVDVSHPDPNGGFSRNKQSAYRKSNLVRAKGNREIDLAFAATSDQAATIALKEIKTAWHEQMTYEWALPLSFAELVPTDIVEYEDEDQILYRIRIEERGEDNDVLSFVGKQDGGAVIYGVKATGLSLPPPLSTTPGLVGPTRIEIINASPFRDQDDELGVYLAVAGETDGWYGAAVMVSTDEISYVEAYRTETPATLGEIEDPLPIGDDSVIVVSNYDLESTDATGILNNANRCVIGDEVLQFTTAQHLGSGRWLLQGLVRGTDVHGTPEESHPAGTRFVLVDTGLQFVQAQRWMLGETLWVKPVSFGTNEDDAVPTEYDFEDAASQTEWVLDAPVITNEGNVYTITVTPRPRLGSTSTHYPSKYFRGYRYEFSDGGSIDTSVTVYTFTNPLPGMQVRVAGLNEITGVGPFSPWVTMAP